MPQPNDPKGELRELPAALTCPICQHKDTVVRIVQTGPHSTAYCGECGGYIQHVKANSHKPWPSNNPPPPMSTRSGVEAILFPLVDAEAVRHGFELMELVLAHGKDKPSENERVIAIWENLFREIPVDRFRKTCAVACRTLDFFPSPNQFGDVLDSPDVTGTIAQPRVDPITNVCTRAGGTLPSVVIDRAIVAQVATAWIAQYEPCSAGDSARDDAVKFSVTLGILVADEMRRRL